MGVSRVVSVSWLLSHCCAKNTLAKTAERGRRDTRLLVQVACARVCLSLSLTLTLEAICVYLEEESARTLKLQEAQIQLNSLEKYLKRIGIKKKNWGSSLKIMGVEASYLFKGWGFHSRKKCS